MELFYQALRAEGLREVDRPGSTCPLSRLSLFRHPKPLFPHYRYLNRVNYRGGQFPIAEHVHQHTLKLPVWHRAEEMPLVDQYIEGFRKVVDNHHEQLGYGNG
ncbi:MAG: hypothetical protein ACRDR6_28960 [Pseudonocardiaceae bacterium]